MPTPQRTTIERSIIGESELQEFIQSETADFAFEMQCVRMLVDLGLSVSHGGTYIDPLKKINRQFDIRASWKCFGSKFGMRLAVECKNVSPTSPLLVYCVPRDPSEAILDRITIGAQNSQPHAVTRPSSRVYRTDAPVGKSCVQVSRDVKVQNGARDPQDFKTSDEGVYDKWSQALASLESMMRDAYTRESGVSNYTLWVPLPVVVLPDDMLWTAEFTNDGQLKRGPQKTDRCSYFVGKEFAPFQSGLKPLTVRHIEFVTESGLRRLVESMIRDARQGDDWFSDS